jgi:general secretion pathway protein A
VVFLSPPHREALAGLCYALLHKKGLIVLLAPAGTGKTTLLARAGAMLMPTRVRFATILNPTLTTTEFIEAMLMSFVIREASSSKPKRLLALHDMLLETQAEGKVAALIIDEAHKLTPEVLEEVRRLGKIEPRCSGPAEAADRDTPLAQTAVAKRSGGVHSFSLGARRGNA